LASSALTRPTPNRSSGLRNSDASLNPPARAIASRSPTAQRCSSSTSSAAVSFGDLRQRIPGLVLVEHPAELGYGGGAQLGTRRHALLAVGAEPDQRADDRP
jgi:hypothetical protein